MKIGIVTTWMERGAAYVSKNYMELLLAAGHQVVIFARGGEVVPSGTGKWNEDFVTRSTKYTDTTIEKRKFFKWISDNHIEAILFNEQQDVRILIDLKEKFPAVKLAAYVDYYTERTIPWFDLYDFLICNTKRHMQAMKDHPQKFYLKWGTDLNVFKPSNDLHDKVTFFHSVGMSNRKGTDVLVDAYINGGLYKNSKLIIHTQIPIDRVCRYNKDELESYGIEIIEKTVTAPGLYYMGDVYVYPTRLDGLGLTMYEALASGMPMITSDFPPMNEVGDDSCVRLVKIQDYYCRSDAYYFPMVICDTDDLINAMQWYIANPDKLAEQKIAARKYAEANYNIYERSQELSDMFEKTEVRNADPKLASSIKKYYKANRNMLSLIRKNRMITGLVKKLRK